MSAAPGTARPRYAVLDALRGLTLISMALYHASWDLVYLFGRDWPWYQGTVGFVWQQSICWCFILLSGFCLPMGRRTLRRGLIVSAAGALVSAVTLLFMPDQPVLFGVLTFLGAAMLLTAALRPLLLRLPPAVGLAASAALFVLTRRVNAGGLGFGGWHLCQLPAAWYANYATTALGFMHPGFVSTDYFSLLPWLFLFWVGFFGYQLAQKRGALALLQKAPSPPALQWLGRHSLGLYLVHQPVLFAVFTLLALLR